MRVILDDLLASNDRSGGDKAGRMTQVLDAVRFGAGRSGETAAPPVAHALKDAIETLATAKTAIDQMTEMLHYFTRLGDSGPLRDYREVKANLLRSRALLSTQPDTVAQLTEAALRLSKLIDINALRTTPTSKRIETPKTAAVPAGVQSAPKIRPSEFQKPRAAGPSENPAVVPESSQPRPRSVRRGFFDQTVANAVFSEIESILRHP
jgi:cell fate (sporulation/competence/biofilm development) regulator YlbF (YheA/YmcA/DUF963 family)